MVQDQTLAAWELLDLISESDGEKLLDLKTMKETCPDDEKVPCVYCGSLFKERGLKRHFKSCQDAPSSSK